MQWLTLFAACGLAVVHLFGTRLRFLDVIPRSRWLSAAGGISVAYVFLHLLPELARGQAVLQEQSVGVFRYLEHHAYLLAFLGLAVFYGMERAAKIARRERPGGPEEDCAGINIFWLHMAAFGLYNGLIGYLLAREFAAPRELVFFLVAMALHFLVTDFGLQEHHKRMFRHMGRWLLAGAVICGWWLGISVHIPEFAMSLLVAFLAGGIILNVLKEELPEERQSRFSAFLLGGGSYAVLLLAL